MSGTSIEHNRRAVYAALARSLPDRTVVQQALRLWEERYAATRVFHVTQYIDDVVKHVGIPADVRRPVVVALYAGLSKPESELPPVPTVIADAVRGTPATATDSAPVNGTAVPAVDDRPAEQVVFSHLVGQMVHETLKKPAADPVELTACVKEQAEMQGAKSPAADMLSRWADTDLDTSKIPSALTEEGMQLAVHAIYLAVCEVLGPVPADHILRGAVSSANELPVAGDFAPDRLL